MSEPIDDGGPAFPLFLPPSETGNNILPIQYGMSLRDWFAGQALGKCLHEFWGENDAAESAAISAYQVADAMLAAQKEKQ